MPRAIVDASDRFTLSIPSDANARLIRAAALEHTTLTEFMLRHSW